MNRRAFIGALGAMPLAGGALVDARAQPAPGSGKAYRHQGRVDDAPPATLDRGRTITSIETCVRGAIGLVRLRTADGHEGWGQVAPYPA